MPAVPDCIDISQGLCEFLKGFFNIHETCTVFWLLLPALQISREPFVFHLAQWHRQQL